MLKKKLILNDGQDIRGNSSGFGTEFDKLQSEDSDSFLDSKDVKNEEGVERTIDTLEHLFLTSSSSPNSAEYKRYLDEKLGRLSEVFDKVLNGKINLYISNSIKNKLNYLKSLQSKGEVVVELNRSSRNRIEYSRAIELDSIDLEYIKYTLDSTYGDSHDSSYSVYSKVPSVTHFLTEEESENEYRAQSNFSIFFPPFQLYALDEKRNSIEYVDESGVKKIDDSVYYTGKGTISNNRNFIPVSETNADNVYSHKTYTSNVILLVYFLDKLGVKLHPVSGGTVGNSTAIDKDEGNPPLAEETSETESPKLVEISEDFRVKDK